MVGVLALLIFAVLVSSVGRAVLQRARWVERAPRLGMWAWIAVAGSVALALVLVGFALLVPDLHLSEHLASAVHACVAEFRDRYSTPLGLGAALTGGTLAALALFRLFVVGVGDAAAVVRQRRALCRELVLLGEPRPSCGHGSGYISVDQDQALVFCVPGGRRPAVVVTSGARDLLSHDELMAALRHENTHLRARHHIPIRIARVLGAAFLYFGVFSVVADQVSRLAELDADDGARDHPGLRGALARLALAEAPALALSMSGGSTVQRIRRISDPPRPLSWGQRAGLTAILGGLLVTPFVLVTVPALLALLFDCCGGAITRS